jgi:hypothetical protein
MSRGVWLFEDSLGPHDPALRAHPGAPAVFVFDDEWLTTHPTSFQRLFFAYESLVETLAGREGPGEVRRGNVVREVIDFCRHYGVTEIHVTRSRSPAYRRHADQLRANFIVVEHAPDELISWPGRPPRRFMDLWKEALPKLLPPEEDADAGAAVDPDR